MNKTEQGSTLLMVIGVFLIIGIVASFIFYRAESEWAATIGFEKKIRFRELAETVLNERLALFANDNTEAYDWAEDVWFDGGRLDEERDGYQITVLIEDESSKLNLNLMSEAAFKVLLDGQMLSPDPILDWRDLDHDPRAEGAEQEYYAGLIPPSTAKDGFFASVEELRQLRNGGDLYASLAPEVTVYGRINPNVLQDENLIKALFLGQGFDETTAESFTQDYLIFIKSHPDGFAKFDNDFRSNFTKYHPIESPKKFKQMFSVSKDNQFVGIINLNMMSQIGLQALFKQIFGDEQKTWITDIVKNRRPFKTMEEINQFFDSKQKNDKTNQAAIKLAKNYCTAITTIVRYRIWVTKGTYQYYLETVEERKPSNVKGEWKVYPLAWRESINNEVPKIPEKPELQEGQDNGGE